MLEVIETVCKPLTIYPSIVIEICAEGIEGKFTAGSNYLFTIVGQAVECTSRRIEGCFESVTCDSDQ